MKRNLSILTFICVFSCLNVQSRGLDGNEVTPDAQITAPLKAKLMDITAALG